MYNTFVTQIERWMKEVATFDHPPGTNLLGRIEPMAENTSVASLLGSVRPNLKDPPLGGTFSKLVNPARNITAPAPCNVVHCVSSFHTLKSLLPSVVFLFYEKQRSGVNIGRE